MEVTEVPVVTVVETLWPLQLLIFVSVEAEMADIVPVMQSLWPRSLLLFVHTD